MNIASAFKAEVLRLARKVVREQVDPVRAGLATQRKQIVELKRQVAALESMNRRLVRSVPKTPSEEPEAEAGRKPKFTAEMLKRDRARLGLTAAQFAALINVTGQSIYSYEKGSSVPRRATLDLIASLRGIGKREALKRLEALEPAATE